MQQNLIQGRIEGQSKTKFIIPPPPPIILLPPPKISNYQYLNSLKIKHSRIVNGQHEQFSNIQDQMRNKMNHLLLKSDQNSIIAESTGQGIQIDESTLVQCERCQKKILKKQIQTHMSCHAAIILENLLLGDKFSADNKKQLLQRNKVTHVVNAANELPNYLSQHGVKYMNLSLLDQLDEENFIQQILKGYRFIKQSHKEDGIVFVHCAVGKSRSVSVILIYLLHEKKIGIEQGLKLIKEKRPIAQPNIAYMKKLRQYQKSVLKQKKEEEELIQKDKNSV